MPPKVLASFPPGAVPGAAVPDGAVPAVPDGAVPAVRGVGAHAPGSGHRQLRGALTGWED